MFEVILGTDLGTNALQTLAAVCKDENSEEIFKNLSVPSSRFSYLLNEDKNDI